MTIEKTVNQDETVLKVSGRLDTTTAPKLEEEVKTLSPDTNLVLDFKDLEYISSAGLRVILVSKKALSGKLVVANINETIKEVFDITGFSGIIDVR